MFCDVLFEGAVKRTALAPGRTCGNTCTPAPSFKNCAVPPAPGIRHKPMGLPRMMLLSSPQLAPTTESTPGVGPSVTADPPSAGAFTILAPVRNPIHSTSGEKKGWGSRVDSRGASTLPEF